MVAAMIGIAIVGIFASFKTNLSALSNGPPFQGVAD
jgi:uncharacterized protein YneF (UPF0154 family)